MSNESSKQKKMSIKIEAIKTPLGPVPTLESIKNIVDGLNILNAEMIRTQETVNSEVFKQMAGIEKELKSLRKLISEEIIAFEAIKEYIVGGELTKRLDKIEKDQIDRMKELSQLLIDFIGSVRVFQDRIGRLLKQSP